MFQVLAFVYENYHAEEACSEPAHLQRKLHAMGFDEDDISEAMEWLAGLNSAARCVRPAASDAPTVQHSTWMHLPSKHSVRVYSVQEQNQLGAACLGYLSYMDSLGILPAHIREVVMDRGMAVAGSPLALVDLKIIILMVFWTFGQEPDGLVLDELLVSNEADILH